MPNQPGLSQVSSDVMQTNELATVRTEEDADLSAPNLL